mmetsp:Transcript_9336/g.13957  ORF Transcript_9336/g.13957 Transcript_9336/m.13957 type:complete len:237 (+) Transcript_9336:121-831(+)
MTKTELKISHENFQDGIISLAKVFGYLSPQDCNGCLHRWMLEESFGTKCLLHPPFFQKKTYIHSFRGSMDEEEEELFLDDSIDILPDSALYNPDKNKKDTKSEEWIEWYFSVVHSHIWGIPILYFNVNSSQGQALSRNEVLHLLAGRNNIFQCDEWAFLSQEEHPLTGIPSFFLHPCETANRLNLILEGTEAQGIERKNASGYIILTWLTMTLQAVGFRIDVAVIQQIQMILSAQS